MTSSSALRPDARLVQLHAERSDPGARLAQALADLEGADWGLLYAGEGALARQLAALLGPGTLRVDGRLKVDRAALAEAGLAVAEVHGDLRGVRGLLLLEPDERLVERARRAGVPVIADATLAPGGHWPARGAEYVVYRDGVTLTGHGDTPLAALFGLGPRPEPAAPAPSDLSVALAVRDVATLPLRLARASRTVVNLAERLGGEARPAGPTALLLAPDAAADTPQHLGGILAATQHVPDGMLLTPGLEDTDRVLALLRGEHPDAASDRVGSEDARSEPFGSATPGRASDAPQDDMAEDDADAGSDQRPPRRDRPQDRRERRGESRRAIRFEAPRRESSGEGQRTDQPRADQPHADQTRADQTHGGPSRFGQPRSEPDRPRTDQPRADQPRPDQPRSEQTRADRPGPDQGRGDRPVQANSGQTSPDQARVAQGGALSPDNRPSGTGPSDRGPASEPVAPARFTFEAPSPEETWEPEIVYSDLDQPSAAALPALSQSVSSGPDAPDEQPDQGELAQSELEHAELDQDTRPQDVPAQVSLATEATAQAPRTRHGQRAPEQASRPEAAEALPVPAPDLPAAPTAPATPDQPGKEDPAASLTDEQAAIYARLREWRNAEAKRQEISRFIIASNATLAEIARRVPYTPEDLRAVKGMGPERLRKYGEQMLAVVRG